MCLGWLTIVKTYGLSLVLLLGGLLVLQSRRWGALGAGALISLAACARLYVIVVGAGAALFLLRRDGWSRRLARELGLLVAGAVVGLAPLLPSMLGDWEAFSFGAFRFYSMREYGQAGFVTGFSQKLEILATVLPLRTMAPGTVQLAGLLLLAVAALLSRRTPRNSVIAYAWIVLFSISIVPSPAYAQYFCMLVPLLAIEGAVFLGTLSLRELAPLLAPAAALYLAMGAYDALPLLHRRHERPRRLSARQRRELEDRERGGDRPRHRRAERRGRRELVAGLLRGHAHADPHRARQRLRGPRLEPPHTRGPPALSRHHHGADGGDDPRAAAAAVGGRQLGAARGHAAPPSGFRQVAQVGAARVFVADR
jgi:hypothetical protein